MINRIVISLTVWALAGPVLALNIGDYRLVDLSHAYNSDTLYWPTSPSRFEKQQLAFGPIEGIGFYAAFSVCTPEHGGTHLDAPQHFAAAGMATDLLKEPHAKIGFERTQAVGNRWLGEEQLTRRAGDRARLGDLVEGVQEIQVEGLLYIHPMNISDN